MKITVRGIELIKHWEGVRYRPYRCSARLFTVGVGHVLYPLQGRLPLDQRQDFQLQAQDDRTFTTEEVDGILHNDLARFERGVTTLCPVSLTQGEFDSLCSFSFNCGLGTLQRSTLRQKILRGEKEAAADEFLKYTIGGGKILKGLVNRRNDERALWNLNY
ncbi:COG3772 Phage-related lysozyme (muraminidase) [uncultured Caudovirales phage]|uniref:Endolysin n=1 Tax=uncultured Caudovirales phage TaxID=2100421 RepID=A0A6J5SI87_9CAUD|nr:COG3772 Phage-related lysozyme (muraminidase) [uncultured Caudovirales phage]CAB4214095.1 COG3772 Phage-related lysozyme (muraminidase) [uncultured Caudovirales phage]